MSNSIDRQATINAIYEEFSYIYCNNCEKELDEDLCEDCHRKYMRWSASKKTIERVINSLPSAQPEIIKCKDCKYWNSSSCECPEHVVYCLDYMVGDMETEAEHFCGYAERRQDG